MMGNNEKDLTKNTLDVFKQKLMDVPESLRTKEVCLAAVQRNGYELKYVPDELKTREICEAAVQKEGVALVYVPDDLKTKELCMMAVQKTGWALEYVPRNMRTPEICEAAVQQDRRILRYVSDHINPREIYRALGQSDDFPKRDCPMDNARRYRIYKDKWEYFLFICDRDSLSFEEMPQRMKKQSFTEVMMDIPRSRFKEILEDIECEEHRAMHLAKAPFMSARTYCNPAKLNRLLDWYGFSASRILPKDEDSLLGL